VDLGANDGGVYVDYGIYKAGDINSRWSYDTRFILGWGNKTFCNYYAPPPVIQTNADPLVAETRQQTMKSMRVQASASYQASDRFSIQPQLMAYRNFMTEYTLEHNALLRFNGAITCSYAF
jgi:hypothetical protein